MQGIEIPEAKLRRRKIFSATLVALNVLIPLTSDISYLYIFGREYFKGVKPKPFAKVLYFIDFDFVGALQIVSGVYLIAGVLRIKRYMNGTTGGENEINTKMLLLHSSAFGLYLLGVVAYYSTYTITNVFGTDGHVY
jgi:hypothetical protein